MAIVLPVDATGRAEDEGTGLSSAGSLSGSATGARVRTAGLVETAAEVAVAPPAPCVSLRPLSFAVLVTVVRGAGSRDVMFVAAASLSLLASCLAEALRVTGVAAGTTGG